MKQDDMAGSIGGTVEVPAGATRVQLFPGYGTWKGRNGLGPYTLEDQAHAEQVIAATVAAMGPVDLHFDYDHQAALAPAAAGTAKAAGWFKRMTADANGIWAEDVQWTPAAAAALGAREYRYASPFFLHDKRGRITLIINAALTNYPNFNMAAVASATGTTPIGSGPVAVPALSPEARELIRRMGWDEATIAAGLAADAATATASADRPASGALSAIEREMVDRFGWDEAAFLAARNAT